MRAYGPLAASYDRLTNDIPYEKILTFMETILRQAHKTPKRVLDLGCGTGSLSILMAQRGYRVIGADLSEEMLTQAAAKAAALPEDRLPIFLHSPMEQLRLPAEQRVDWVVCCLDSLNYVTRPSDCRRALQLAWENLRPGGMLIFDINSRYKLKRLDGQTFLDEDEDVYCVWRTEYNEKTKICFYGMDLFQKQGTQWHRSWEEHREYAYSVPQLTGYLEAAGFENIRTFGDRRLSRPLPREQRVYFAAEKRAIP